MWTCDNGHAISPGDEYCGRCGAYVRPGDLSGPPQAVQPGWEPLPGQAEHATEYPGDPSGEYAPLFSSGSFTEFIEATSETDIPPFPAGPLPAEVTPGAYGPDDGSAAGPGPAAAGPHDEPDAPDEAAAGFHDYDEPGPSAEPGPDVRDYEEPGTADEAVPGVGDYDEPGAPDEAAPGVHGYEEPGAPGGGVPDFFGRGGLSAAETAVPGFYRRSEPDDSGPDLSGDGTATPVSGFHALLRVPAAPPAEWPAPPRTVPPRTAPPGERAVPPVEWAPQSPRTAPRPEERISPPGEWHITSRPGAASGGQLGHWRHGQRRPGPRPRQRGDRDHPHGARSGDGDDGGSPAAARGLPADPLAGTGYRRPAGPGSWPGWPRWPSWA